MRAALLLIVAFGLLPGAGWCRATKNQWVPTWSTAPHAGEVPFQNQTIRMIVRSTLGGDTIRVRFSNLYGHDPLAIRSAHVALAQSGSAIQPGSDRTLTFGGQDSMSVPPGAYALSDPVNLNVPPLSDLAVSLFVPVAPTGATMHENGLRTTYVSPLGNYTAAITLPPGSTSLSYYWLTGVYVQTSKPARAFIAFGDSITDGAEATPNTDSSWPSVLGKLMLTQAKPSNMAVLNEGIGGNRLLHDVFGDNALARFDRDVIDQPDAGVAILLEGINDIGYPSVLNGHYRNQAVTAPELIQAMQQIIARCHMHHIKIVGGTLTPYLGAGYASPSGEQIRETVNQWIRGSGAFDAVVDFDKAVEDPANPGHFLPAYDSGDHLHPNDTGYKAMAEAAFKIVSRIKP